MTRNDTVKADDASRENLDNKGPRSAQTRSKSDDAPLFKNYAQLCTAFQSAQWLVKGVIPANATGILFGESNAYKSFIALDLALHIAHGLNWCGRKTKRGAALFIAGEGGSGIVQRIDAWHRHHGRDPMESLFRACTVPVALNRPGVIASVKKSIRLVATEIGDPRLIVVDTLSQNYDGDENDAGEMASLFRNLITEIRTTYPGCTILLIHHPGHDGSRARGSYTIKANTDFMFRAKSTPFTATLTCEKMKDADFPSSISFNLHRIDLGTDEDGDPLSSLAADFVEIDCGILDPPKKRRYSKHGASIMMILRDIEKPIAEYELRRAFYRTCGSEMRAGTKCKAFNRALSFCIIDGSIVRRQDNLLCLASIFNDGISLYGMDDRLDRTHL